MGQILIEMEKAGEIASKGGNGSNQHGANIVTRDICSPKTLKDLDITLDQSSRYKALANAPAEAFERAREHQQGARLLSNVMVRPRARERRTKNAERGFW